MNLKRYELFIKAVLDSEYFSKHAHLFTFYRFHNGAWYDDEANIVSDKDIIRRCDARKGSDIPVKYNKEGYYYIPEIDTVLAIQFNKSVQYSTLSKGYAEAKTCYSRADTEYLATHSKTGLVNEPKFKALLKDELEKILSEATGAAQELQRLPQSRNRNVGGIRCSSRHLLLLRSLQ